MAKTKDIREAVNDELAFDPMIDTAYVTVKNVDGEIALNGTVPSYPQRLEAAAAARRVAGVTYVHNHLEVVLPFDSYRDDPTLTTIANNALLLDVTVPAGVEATAKDGNVALTGTVRSGVQSAASEAAVAGLVGVRNIKNQIRINTDADPVDVSLLVQSALNRYALIEDDSAIIVDTNPESGSVTLSGHVSTWAEHNAVIDAAWRAIGVYDVLDHLNITG